MSYGSPTAAYALFLQFYGDSVFERVLEMVGSCSSSIRMYGICLQSFLKLALTGM